MTDPPLVLMKAGQSDTDFKMPKYAYGMYFVFIYFDEKYLNYHLTLISPFKR